jgi:Leucine-rich repeat (LRR) protein
MLTKMTDDFGLSGNRLRGTIPTQLGKLTKLSNDFELQGNQLTGTIPEILGMLTNLGAETGEAHDSDFLLGGNDLTGTIPASLGNLTKLDGTLGLSNNNFGPGSVPAELGALTRLETLDLRNNDMLCGSLDFSIQTLDAEVLISGTHINSPCYYSADGK